MLQHDEYVLTLQHVDKNFPGVKALSDVSLNVKKGEVHALCGENGAGKSTLMKILSGAYHRDAGEIYIEGEQVQIDSPQAAERLGISIIYQELNQVNALTVAENIFLGKQPTRYGIVDWRRMYQEAQRLLDSLDIPLNAKGKVASLTIAQRQLVEIAKSVVQKAKVVIMDEPTSSLTTAEAEILFRLIQSLKQSGTAVIFITHRLDEVFQISDSISVLRDGCYIGSNPTSDMTKDALIQMMIGRVLTQQYPKRNAALGEEVLRAEGITDEKKIKGVSFSVKSGEVLGFVGLVGAGRTETMRMIFGVDKKESGRIFVRGQEVAIRSPIDAIRMGIGFVTENRKEEGLLLPMACTTNISIVALKTLKRHGMLSLRREKEVAEDYVKRLRIVTPYVTQKVGLLSGGNQQKVVLAKWLFANCDVIILDEPTRGIDVGAKREIYELINQLAESGKAVIVISSEMEEVMGISDRILVMHEGAIAGEVPKGSFSQEIISRYAIGG